MTRSVSSPVGDCPRCGEEVPRSHVLIEYERANGTRGVFAECPRCGEVVRPE